MTSLLPSLALPRVTRLTGRAAAQRAAARLDAIVVAVNEDAADRVFDELPEPERWRALRERAPLRAGEVRTTTLANRTQSLAALGILRKEANVFEAATLAGRLMKEVAARRPRTLALFAPGARRGETTEVLLQAALAQSFALPSFRSTQRPARQGMQSITLAGDTELDLRFANAASRGNNLARWLTALPPNKLDAPGYRRLIASLARERGIALRWLDERALRRLGANAFLAVSAGNARRTAGIAHLRYRPRGRAARSPAVALVGKGILFDTGGTNLKPHRAMLDMHTDMAGSAVALATLFALAELRAPIAADAWLPITENRIGPEAYRPQDIVQAANGVTIQVVHTDAEGRMVLADTLALASRTRPRFIIDFATLTGAAVYALTERMSAVFTNRPALEAPLVAAGRASGERVWSFPLDADYDSDIESKVADIAQCAVEGKGDHILAARFLSRFVPRDIAWAHVDLSSAMRSGGLGAINTDVTGFGVRYALELLLRQKVLDAVGARA